MRRLIIGLLIAAALIALLIHAEPNPPCHFEGNICINNPEAN